jgi:hypothetical protein
VVATDDGTARDGFPVYTPVASIATMTADDGTLWVRPRAMSAKGERTKDDWAPTADIATPVDGDRFQVLGRASTAADAAGGRVTAELVEARLRESVHVRHAVVVFEGSQAVAFVVPSSTFEQPVRGRLRRSTPTRTVQHVIQHDVVDGLNTELAAAGGPTIADVQVIDDPGRDAWTPDGAVRAEFRRSLARPAGQQQVVAS